MGDDDELYIPPPYPFITDVPAELPENTQLIKLGDELKL
jgi:hypothetical protein